MEEHEVKLIDGTTATAKIKPLGYVKRNEILKASTKTKMLRNSTESELDIFHLQTEVMRQCVEGVDINKLTSESGDEIFHKYFSDAFGVGGQQGNSEKNSESQ